MVAKFIYKEETKNVSVLAANKKYEEVKVFLKKAAPDPGIEPGTFGSSDKCFIN